MNKLIEKTKMKLNFYLIEKTKIASLKTLIESDQDPQLKKKE